MKKPIATIAITLTVIIAIVMIAIAIKPDTNNNDTTIDTTVPETTEPEVTESETTTDIISCICSDINNLSHNFQIVEYTANFHVFECDGCGVQVTENHVLMDEIFDNQHTHSCKCGYVSTLHIGVEYTEFEGAHQGTCKCGYNIIEEHELIDFECYDCEFKVNGSVYGVIESITYRQNYARIYLVTAEETYCLKDYEEDTCYNEGDFVVIDHEGEIVTDISVLVNGEIIHDEENFTYYISAEIDEASEDLVFEDLIIDKLQYNDVNNATKITGITFESGTRFMGFSDYIVFDLIECEIGELEEGYAYLTLVTGDMVYFICFW